MTIKQFKKRWLMSKIKPELFYMPVNKKETGIGRLVVWFYKYNTFNIDTEVFSTTGRTEFISAIAIVKNENGDVVYKTDGYSYSIITELPLGTYYVKIVSAYGVVLDEAFHKVVVDKNYEKTGESIFLKITLPFQIFQEKHFYINEAPTKVWEDDVKGDYVSCNSSLYLSRIEVSDKFTKEKYISFSGLNNTDIVGYKIYGKTCLNDSYKKEIWETHIDNAVFFRKYQTSTSVSNTYMIGAKPSGDYVEGDFETLAPYGIYSDYTVVANNAARHIEENHDIIVYDAYTEEIISQSHEKLSGYTNAGSPRPTTSYIVSRIEYEYNTYSSNPTYNFDSIDPVFFNNGNQLVYKQSNGSYNYIKTWNDYINLKDDLNNAEVLPLYDNDLQILKDNFNIESFRSQPYGGQNFISSDSTSYKIIKNQNNVVSGYVKFSENTLLEQNIYVTGFYFEVRSADYNDYF